MIFKKLFGSKPIFPVRREVATSTGTVVIYDLDRLKHRVSDDIDWWSDPKDEVEELVQRNVLIIGLQSDGYYDVEVTNDVGQSQQIFSLNFPSGNVFVGPGEELSGGGDEPTGKHGGFFIAVDPGDYRVGVVRHDERLTINLTASEPFGNPDKPVLI